MPLLYEDYAGRVKPSKLDQQLDQMNPGVDKHLTKIARELVHLDELTAELGVKNQTLRDLEKKHPGDRPRQRLVESRSAGYKQTIIFFSSSIGVIFLRVWKQEHGTRATYAELLKACVETNNSDSAEVIVTLLNSESSIPE